MNQMDTDFALSFFSLCTFLWVFLSIPCERSLHCSDIQALLLALSFGISRVNIKDSSSVVQALQSPMSRLAPNTSLHCQPLGVSFQGYLTYLPVFPILLFISHHSPQLQEKHISRSITYVHSGQVSHPLLV